MAIDGVSEHTEMLSNLITSTAKREQRSITIALMDLRNAFVEVHHKLIAEALKFHHVPIELIDIFQNIYENNCIAFHLTKHFLSLYELKEVCCKETPAPLYSSTYVSIH